MNEQKFIRVVGAREHNLKNVSVDIPRGRLTVITGPSGSGKSSLAFDTIFAEGQRRFVESLSTYARQFLGQLPRPDVDRIEGLTPSIAIEQRQTIAGPRSTVATSTELHDFLRVLFARLGVPHCWECGRVIQKQSIAQMVNTILRFPANAKLMVLAPLVSQKVGSHVETLQQMAKEGFVRARVDGTVCLLEEAPTVVDQAPHSIEVVVDRLTIKSEMAERMADSLESASRLGGGRVIVSVESGPSVWNDTFFSTVPACPVHPNVVIDELTPPHFSFNSPSGACGSCHGLGITTDFDPDLVVPNVERSITDGAVVAFRKLGPRFSKNYQHSLMEFCRRQNIDMEIPFRELSDAVRQWIVIGKAPKGIKSDGEFAGVLPMLTELWNTTESSAVRQRLHQFLAESPCESCHGTRLGQTARCVKANQKSIADISQMTVTDARAWFDRLEFEIHQAPVAEPLLREIRHRLAFLEEIGVGYLTLDRPTATLSGGEGQRIRLATQIGSGLSGICYVLDEPTIGLHPRDTRRLAELLRKLVALDNTVIVVEHDEELIAGADFLVDVGPGAAQAGGEIVAVGLFESVLENPASITAKYMKNRGYISTGGPKRTPDWSKCMEIRGATAHNLKHINVKFPLGCLVCVTGVSGSGKSTLVSNVLLRSLKRQIERGGPRPGAHEQLIGAEQVNAVVEVDQSPIGRTPRGNPATFIGAFDLIRQLFAKTREARVRGYNANRFSFNVAGGRCHHCEGQGTRRVVMHFLPDVYVECPECRGSRYNRETLEIRYRGKSIADVLAMTVDEACSFFENFAHVARRLDTVRDVGLGYLQLGQASNTLSGGEAQRIKLAAQLHREPVGHTVYILDEPTTGLHFADVETLLGVLQRLVDRGQTVICIEHHLDVIRSADWVIDIGPEGGVAGGRIVIEGPPEAVAKCAESQTGACLAQSARK